MEQTVLLRMTDITKTFPGVKALDHVSLEVKAGTVHALMGENGAGKSTLMKCLFGIYSKDSGHIYLEGREVNFTSSKEALNNGVAMVHQELNQALKRTVMDNLWLGRYPKIAGFIVDEHKMLRDTKAIFEELGIDVDPHRVMGTMPVSQRQMVEIAKAVSYHSKVIVFDEPTSSLTEEEVEHLFRIINMLRDRGMGIIYISHKMAEIKRISDEITVMRDGQLVATRPASELEMNDIIRLMVGRELGNQFPPKTNKPGEVYLEVEHLTGLYNNLRDVSFTARRGEIVGLAGLDGSGRTETLETMFGVATRKSGRILLDGRECKNLNPRQSIKNNFALLTEERRATGIFGIQRVSTAILYPPYSTRPTVTSSPIWANFAAGISTAIISLGFATGRGRLSRTLSPLLTSSLTLRCGAATRMNSLTFSSAGISAGMVSFCGTQVRTPSIAFTVTVRFSVAIFS